METQRVTLAIYGLGCGGGGSLSVERALARLPGVLHAYVNPTTEMAYVQYDSGRVTPRQMLAAVEQIGYRAGEPAVR